MLNKIGVSDYDYHNLQDLKQILFCEDVARSNSEIRNQITTPIKEITFFAPHFNLDKIDASNYSCAIAREVSPISTEPNDDVAIISYRPSYVSGIPSDLVIKKGPSTESAESKK